MLDKTKMILSFAIIFICTSVGALISWVYMNTNWFTGAYYGAAIGCGIYAAMMTDTSEKKPRREHI
jgi:hypothetical protein